jgi:hypothetical protein
MKLAPFAALLIAAIVATLDSATASEPPRIAIRRNPSGVTLTWAGGGRLETAAALPGPWTALDTAASPHRVDLSGVAAFYRIRQVYALTVTRAGSGSGTVRSTAPGILCGGDCTETLPAGDTLTLRATPEVGSAFAGWGGDCAGTGDCVLAMDAARTVTATFTSAASANPFVNGDFEQGPSAGWEQAPGQVVYPTANLGGAQPLSGQYAAYLGFEQDGRRQVRLGQRVQLPNRQPLFLNFAAWIYSKELCDVPWYDRITLYINSQVVYQDDRVCQGSGTDGWVRYSVDLTPLAGQSVAVVFEIYSVDGLWSALLLDDIAIADKAWGE